MYFYVVWYVRTRYVAFFFFNCYGRPFFLIIFLQPYIRAGAGRVTFGDVFYWLAGNRVVTRRGSNGNRAALCGMGCHFQPKRYLNGGATYTVDNDISFVKRLF